MIEIVKFCNAEETFIQCFVTWIYVSQSINSCVSPSSSPLDCRLITVGHWKGKWKIKSAEPNVSVPLMSHWLNISVEKHVVISLHAPKRHLEETSAEVKRNLITIQETQEAVKHQFKHNRPNYCSHGPRVIVLKGEIVFVWMWHLHTGLWFLGKSVQLVKGT